MKSQPIMPFHPSVYSKLVFFLHIECYHLTIAHKDLEFLQFLTFQEQYWTNTVEVTQLFSKQNND